MLQSQRPFVGWPTASAAVRCYAVQVRQCGSRPKDEQAHCRCCHTAQVTCTCNSSWAHVYAVAALLLAALVSKAVTAAAFKPLASSRKPNFIIILTDDQVTQPATAAAAAAGNRDCF